MNEVVLRLKKVVNWLIFNEVAENERALADLLGYTKSSFSQLVNGKVPLSDKFLRNLCSLDKNINIVWIKTGEGDMFRADKSINISQTADNNSGVITNNVEARGGNTSNTTTTTTNNYAECDKYSNNLGKALDEIAEQRKLVAKAQGQIDRLITLLENK